MLSPTEIYDNVEALIARRPDRAGFGLELMDAVGAPRATITKLRAEAASGGSFAWTRMLRFALVDKGATVPWIEAMRAEEESKPKARRTRIVIAYDGDAIAICDTKVGDEQRLSLDALAYEADILFPLGGHERHVPDPERLADIRATKHLSRLFDAVRDANPGWKGEADRYALNVFMARVMFCLFSDDVGIFEKDALQTAMERSTGADGGDLQDFLAGAFTHMDLEPETAKARPARGWSRLPYVNGDPEHVRSKAIITPPILASVPRRRGRPPKNGYAHPLPLSGGSGEFYFGPRGRMGGRPRKMDRATLVMAVSAMADCKSVAAKVARRLNLTTTALYT